jgi:hypothetical protein
MAASSFHIERFQKELTHNESLQIETFHTTNPQISLAYEGPPIHTDFVQSWYFFTLKGRFILEFFAMLAVFLFLSL